VEALRYLLSAEVGAEVEAKDQYGSTALHFAALAGHIEVLGALVELGASADPDGDGGARLLSFAATWCKGDDAAERKAATVTALRELGVGDGSGTDGGDGRGEQSAAELVPEPELEPEPEPEPEV
jgi:ankyrin repeat protein